MAELRISLAETHGEEIDQIVSWLGKLGWDAWDVTQMLDNPHITIYSEDDIIAFKLRFGNIGRFND